MIPFGFYTEDVVGALHYAVFPSWPEKPLHFFFSSILRTRIHWISEEYTYAFFIFSLASKELKALLKDANNARLIKKKIPAWKIRMGKIR